MLYYTKNVYNLYNDNWEYNGKKKYIYSRVFFCWGKISSDTILNIKIGRYNNFE